MILLVKICCSMRNMENNKKLMKVETHLTMGTIFECKLKFKI